MAVHQEQAQSISGGSTKKIDAGAQALMFELLQKNQYQYPVKSIIRELASNGLDSIKERDIAKSILTGKTRVEDHYAPVPSDNAVYKDSKFNPDYYDLAWLSDDPNVTVTYYDGGEIGKDTVVIKDPGVGLGGQRLKGYFDLGYSTKRLAKYALGKFGLGAKVGLATGEPFYTTINRYNGQEFRFNVYSMKFESLIGEFNLETGERNLLHTIPDLDGGEPFMAYSQRTEEKNGLEISVAVKKHHKQQYIDAVTSQLLYFNNVKCFIAPKNGPKTEVPVSASILYEDDLIVLSHNSPYSKPHLLLNNVNYGYIDFRELELEEKLGNIGIKVRPESVSINPSRESLIWDDRTRETIVNKFHEVVSIAQNTINKQLKEEDFLKWLRVCASTSASKSWNHNQAKDTVLGRLSQIVDMEKVELEYPLNKFLKFNYATLDGLRVNTITLRSMREGAIVTKKIDYDPRWKSAMQEGLPLYIKFGKTSNRQNKFMTQTMHPQGFICIDLDTLGQEMPEGGLKPLEKIEVVQIGNTLHYPVTAADIPDSPRVTEMISQTRNITADKAKARIAMLHNYILASKDIQWYEDIIVPEDYSATEEVEEQVEDEKEPEIIAEKRLSAAERRKLEGKIITHHPQLFDGDKSVYTFGQEDLTAKEIDSWSNEEIFYTSQDFEPIMHTAAMLTRPNENLNDDWIAGNGSIWMNPWAHDTYPIRLVKVAKQNVKYFRDFKHITKFFKEVKGKTLTMSSALIRWNTARLIKKDIHHLKFLSNFGAIDATKQSAYNTISTYANQYYRNFQVQKDVKGADANMAEQLIDHLEKVGQFQLFVRDNPDDGQAISQMAKMFFNPEPGVDIHNGLAIEVEMYDLFKDLLDWAEPVKVMANMLIPLVNAHVQDVDGEADDIISTQLTSEQEEEIRRYFQYRNVPL